MKKTVKNKKGITLIALIITVIIMLILAGVAITAVTNDGGLFNKTTYTAELSKFKQIKEAIRIYNLKEMMQGTTTLPVRNNVTVNELNQNIALKNEIGYYRVYLLTQKKPVEIQDFSAEFTEIPSGIGDLYYLDANKLGANLTGDYIYDVVTGEIYSVNEIKLKGKIAFGENGINTIMNPDYVPEFVTGRNLEMPASPVPGTGVGYDFKFADIANTSTNFYKIYNNGDVYAIGARGYGLNTSKEEMEAFRTDKWTVVNFRDI